MNERLFGDTLSLKTMILNESGSADVPFNKF